MIEIKVNKGMCDIKAHGMGYTIIFESATALNGIINIMARDSGIPRKDLMQMICMATDKMNDSYHLEIHRNGEAREAET